MDGSGPSRDRGADPAGLVLPRTPRSVALLRHYAAEACHAVGWPSVGDTVALLVSEVATDLVLNAHGDRVRVRVLDRGLRLRVEVVDAHASRPEGRGARHSGGTRGRELLMVEALCSAWGTGADVDGEAFWFELGV